MKKFITFLALTIAFSLSGCQKSEEMPVEPETVPEEVVIQETIVEETGEEVAEESEPLVPEAVAPTVTMDGQEGSAEYRGYTLTYTIATPVLTDFSEEATEVIERYYTNMSEKYLSYLENEAVYQLEALQWDGEFQYNYGCRVTYLDDNYVTFLRTIQEPAQQDYIYSETFSLENGGLVTLDYLFGLEQSACRTVILDYLLDNISNDDELLPQFSQRDPDWKTSLSNQLDLDQFYLHEDGLGIYFQYNQLALGTGFSVIIPWKNLPEIQS